MKGHQKCGPGKRVESAAHGVGPWKEQIVRTQEDGHGLGKDAAVCHRGRLDLLDPSSLVLHSWFHFIAQTLQGAADHCKRLL